MAGGLRNIGWRIKELVNEDTTVRDNLCKLLNFSIIDYEKLCSGRLAIAPIQLKKIISFFNIDWKDVFYIQSNYHYHYGFTSRENCDEVLDIIDSYIDVKEAAN